MFTAKNTLESVALQLVTGLDAGYLRLPKDATEASTSLAVRSIPRWKRASDLVLVFVGSPIWVPIMVLMMIWIRVRSPGPIFYRQECVGYREKRFMRLKFRTRDLSVQTQTHEEYFARLMNATLPMSILDQRGPRLIPAGRFLRMSHLDDLPQIFNVLRGEMSLVGPPPWFPFELQRSELWTRGRLSTRPGLTGYSQVLGKNKLTFREMVAVDIFYAQNMSLWLDCWVLLKTIQATVESWYTTRPEQYARDAEDTEAEVSPSPIPPWK